MSDQTRDKPSFWIERFPSGAVFLLVAMCFFKFLWLNPLTLPARVANWKAVEAVIEDSSVTLDSAWNEYELAADFSAEYEGVTRDYRLFLNTGRKGRMERLAAAKYPHGAKITVLINPADPTEFTYRTPTSYGPWIAGFAPGVLFTLVAISVMVAPRKTGNDANQQSAHDTPTDD